MLLYFMKIHMYTFEGVNYTKKLSIKYILN